MPTAIAASFQVARKAPGTSRIDYEFYAPHALLGAEPTLPHTTVDLPTNYTMHAPAWRRLASMLALSASPVRLPGLTAAAVDITSQLTDLLLDYTNATNVRRNRRGSGTVAEVLPPAISSRLRLLTQLPANWDGGRAAPPTRWALTLAWVALRQLRQVLPAAFERLAIVPAITGGIRLEWVASDRELTVIIPPDEQGMVEVYRYSQNPPFEEDVEERTIARLPELVQWFQVR